MRGLPWGRGFPERLSIALPQSREHALDMLAGPETVGAVVNTAAGIAETLQIADFDVVEAGATPRLHAERAEKRVPGFQHLDGDDLGAAPPAAQRNFIVVSGPPPLRQRRSIQHGAGFFSHTTFRPHS